MDYVFIPSRTLKDATPALLSFLPLMREYDNLFLYLTINNFCTEDNNRIIELYPQDRIEVVRNPYTLDYFGGSFPKFMLKTLKRFHEFLIGHDPKYKESRIVLTNDDIYIQDPRPLILQNVKDLPAVPELIPQYKVFCNEWLKDLPEYWDWYGLTILGEWLTVMEKMLEKAIKSNLSAGSGTVVSAAVVAFTGLPINKLKNVIAYSTRCVCSTPEGALQDSLNCSIKELVKLWAKNAHKDVV